MSNRKGAKRAASRIASPDDCIAVKFEASADDWESVIGSRAEWIQRAGDEYPALRIGAASLKQNDVGITDMVREVGVEAVLEIVECLGKFTQYHKAIGEVAETITTRMMVGLHRIAYEEETEAPSS